ncbi:MULTISPECIES: hypothetical protein [unclassified Synechocystis]|uniref:hypothetical protein n=1 Tax=unclassified Synechocystis TaxID=2640012 RepID=UPI00048C9926|nr:MULTISPECIES: hypothetical protein [unclassified Synechocystis]MCT0254979.1 hypothetical protein [Synechocystis sp. CS-94]
MLLPNQIPFLFSQKIQIGQLNIPVGIFFYLLACSSVVAILNYKYLQKYNQLITYIKRHYPDTYEQIRHRPDVAGIGYSKGYKRLTPLIKLSKGIDEFNDPKLSKMLFDFIEFDRSFMIFSSALIVFMIIVGLTIGIYLFTSTN